MQNQITSRFKMSNKVFTSAFLPLLCLLLVVSACKNSRKAQKMSPSMAAFVYAHTSGSVARDAAVRVRFTAPIVAAEQVGTNADPALLKVTPSVKGQLVWEDQQTLRFTPQETYSEKTQYLAKVAVDKVFKNVPTDAQTFEFNFNPRKLSFEVVTEGIEPENPNDWTKQDLIGEVITSDAAKNELVEKTITATQNGNKQNIVWSHTPDGIHHSFRVKGLNRQQSASSVELKWNGEPLNVDYDGSQTIDIPALGDFKMIDMRVVQDGEDQYIKAWFSDPLSRSQDLLGLVSLNFGGDKSYLSQKDSFEINPNNLKFSIEGNAVKIFPTGRISGKRIVNFNDAIRNAKNEKLKQPTSVNLTFDELKPAIRLVGSGTILPESEGLLFPFEAVGLHSVEVEVFKIYNNNILEYFKSNELNRSYNGGLENVGSVILQQRINLKDLNANAKSERWSRYALDLSKLIKADPQAIYQIRLATRLEYSNLACVNRGELQGMATVQNIDYNSDDFVSVKDSKWHGIDDNDYNYEGADDPCNKRYYANNYSNTYAYAESIVIPSNVGIIAKRGSDGSMFMVANDLRTTEPKAGVKLEVFNRQNQLLGSLETDANGVARFDTLRTKPYIVIATEKDGRRGYLPLSDANSLSLSRFNVDGVAPQKGLKGFLYGERGVWRPGDSLYLNFIVEDKTTKLPENFPITLELFDPRGILSYRTVSMSNVKNIYPFHISTRPDAPTGTWRADVKVGGATFSQPLKIETVKPNRLKINLDLPKTEVQAGGENFTANLQVNWLHGAAARSVKARVEAVMQSIPTEWKGKYKDVVFDCPVRSFKADPISVFESNVNENGAATVNFNLPKPNNAPGKMRVALKLRAFEPSGDFSSDYRAFDYSPFNSYAGVLIPKNKWGEKRFDIGKNGRVKIYSVDSKGTPLSNRTLTVTLYRREWRWWWENSYDESSEFSQATNLKKLREGTVTTNGAGEAEFDVRSDEWGRYLVYVTDPLSMHATGDYFYSGYPWDGEDDYNSGQSRNNAAMLNFSTNKEKYLVGENIELNIPTGEGKALISIENGSKVLSSEWISTKNGMTSYRLKATPDMAPTAYAFVTLVQPHAKKDNDLPIRMYGVMPLDVENPTTKLEPIAKMPDVLRPEEKFTIEVSEKNRREMAYTVAIVDEGLLDLTRFKTPNPWDEFYAREALGVQTFDVYEHVLGAYGGKFERILSVGGDKALKPRNAQRANRFRPVVRHLGPFLLKAGGSVRHTIELPNYIGAVRAMVVASDGKAAYGATEKTAPVRKPLMVLATLPRMLSPNEVVKLPVEVFAMENKINNATITVQETSGLVSINGQKSKSVTFEKTPMEKMVDFDVVVGQRVGIAKFKIIAQGGGETSTDEIEIDIRNPNPILTDVKQTVLAAGQTWGQQFAPLGVAGTNKVMVEVSTIPPIDLAKRLGYLLAYPHGCVEQTTSAAFPQLYVSKLLNLTEGQKNLAYNHVKAALENLKKYQTATGAFGYWAGDVQGDDWATTYVGHFLLEAQNNGYTLPPNMIDRWTKAQQQIARRWTAPTNNQNTPNSPLTEGGVDRQELMQAYRLFTLALAKSPEMGAMNLLKERPNLTIVARWRLAAAYALAGKPEIGKQLINGAATTVPQYRELSFTFGSELRDQAMILETLQLLGDQNRAWQVAQEVARGLSSGDWYATQSVSFGLLAMAKFVGNNKIGENFSFSYDLNGKTGTAQSTSPIFQIEVPENQLYKLNIRNNHKNQLFVRIISRGQPSTQTAVQASAGGNLQMQVAYKTLKGEPLNPSRITQGTDFIAEVTVRNAGTLGRNFRELALTQVFPSGWEVMNPRMDKVEGFTNTSAPEYQDLRDDRVMTYFDLANNKLQTYRIRLNAAYLGKFYLPMTTCEAMYDSSISAAQSGAWVEVVDGGKNPM